MLARGGCLWWWNEELCRHRSKSVRVDMSAGGQYSVAIYSTVAYVIVMSDDGCMLGASSWKW